MLVGRGAVVEVVVAVESSDSFSDSFSPLEPAPADVLFGRVAAAAVWVVVALWPSCQAMDAAERQHGGDAQGRGRPAGPGRARLAAGGRSGRARTGGVGVCSSMPTNRTEAP